MGSVGSNSLYRVTSSQSEWEERYRGQAVEHGAYFDKDGKVLLEGTGTGDEISFDPIDMNHEVEQRVWAGEQVDFTHNHPVNTIFSPEDIEAFEDLENHSERAILPDGTNYTIIREQPMTDNTLTWNAEKNDFDKGFQPQKIAPAYRQEYDKVFDPAWEHVKATTRYGTPERQRAMEKMDKQVAKHMENWLKKNAKRYGYRFEKS